ncbi:hypothetical protein ACP4OV_027053 [Aristida adscensionis]
MFRFAHEHPSIVFFNVSIIPSTMRRSPATTMASPRSCLVALVLAAAVATSAGQDNSGGGEAAADDPFVSESCSTTEYPEVCSGALLPFASSFQGSRIKIAVAAATILMADLDAFLKELRALEAASPGKYDLAPCVQVAADGTEGQRERLARFKALGDAGDDKLGEREEELAEFGRWLAEVERGYDKCFTVATAIPNVEAELPSDEGVDHMTAISRDLAKGLVKAPDPAPV